MKTKTVTVPYIDGIKEGREVFKREGMSNAAAHLDNLNRTVKGFAAGTPVGDMLRGERDFWINQMKRAA